MVIGTLEDGRKCVYDLPTEIKTAEQFKNLIYDYHDDVWAERQQRSINGVKCVNYVIVPGWLLAPTVENKKKILDEIARRAFS